MREAAALLVGEHDFKSFCCVRTQTETTVRHVYGLEISEQDAYGAKMFTIRITGNGFLYNMVRIIAGTLVQVGKGQLSADDVAQLLEAKDRTAAGQTAPPQGLTLMKIEYVDGDAAEYRAVDNSSISLDFVDKSGIFHFQMKNRLTHSDVCYIIVKCDMA